MQRFSSVFFKASGLALSMLFSVPAASQYPNKPVRLIVPFPAGGASDAAARTIGRALSKSLGQSIVIDNRPGANGAIAAQTVLTAPPDGYTLLWGVSSMVAIPLLQKNPAFDSLASFTAVSMTGRFAFGLFVHPNVPAKNVDELVKHTRANADKLSFAAGTMGEYLAAAQFMKATKTTVMRVPYKGGAQAMPDLLAGRVQLYFTPLAIALPYAKEGRLRMLGTLLPQRSPAAPDVPTMAEAGFPGVTVPTWQAIFAPPKTATGLAGRISRDVNQALQDTDVKLQFERLVLQGEGTTPERLAAIIGQDVETWRLFIREYDIPQE
jgi:tripartite-type tricarboxylate transporter receptor subunit TctC